MLTQILHPSSISTFIFHAVCSLKNKSEIASGKIEAFLQSFSLQLKIYCAMF